MSLCFAACWPWSYQTPLFSVVSATDASLHHGAVVETVCDLPKVAWLWSRASLRGSYSHGAWPAHYNPGGDLVQAEYVMHSWISGVQFKEVLALRFAKKQHMDLLEMRAHTRAVRASKSLAAWRSRHVMDSGV